MSCPRRGSVLAGGVSSSGSVLGGRPGHKACYSAAVLSDRVTRTVTGGKSRRSDRQQWTALRVLDDHGTGMLGISPVTGRAGGGGLGLAL